MANKWMRKLGIGMSVIMAVSQLSTGMVLAAPEEVFDEDVEIEEEVFEDSEDGFGDILEERFEDEEEYDSDTKEWEKAICEEDLVEEWEDVESYYYTSNEVVNYALQFEGYPYRSSDGPDAFDCSGLVKYVYGHFGIDLPWGTRYFAGSGYSQYGEKILNRDDLIPGDLVYFGSSANDLGHVGIYIGNGAMINALNPSKGVCCCFIDQAAYNKYKKSYSFDIWYNSSPYQYGVRIYGNEGAGSIPSPSPSYVENSSIFTRIWEEGLTQSECVIYTVLDKEYPSVSEFGFYLSTSPDMSNAVRKGDGAATHVQKGWYSMNKYYGTLTSGTTYYYKFYTTINGVEYRSGVHYFTTPAPEDITPPVINEIKIIDITGTGYTVAVSASDNVGVQRVAFPIWTEANGQDDLMDQWWDYAIVTTPDADGYYKYRVNIADHNNETGVYCSEAFVYDDKRNEISARAEDVFISPLQSISLSEASFSMKIGDMETLTVSKNPSNTSDPGTPVWSSSNTDVAKVDANGKVTAVAAGEAVVSACISDVIATCNITVTSELISVDPVSERPEVAISKVYADNITANNAILHVLYVQECFPPLVRLYVNSSADSETDIGLYSQSIFGDSTRGIEETSFDLGSFGYKLKPETMYNYEFRVYASEEDDTYISKFGTFTTEQAETIAPFPEDPTPTVPTITPAADGVFRIVESQNITDTDATIIVELNEKQHIYTACCLIWTEGDQGVKNYIDTEDYPVGQIVDKISFKISDLDGKLEPLTTYYYYVAIYGENGFADSYDQFGNQSFTTYAAGSIEPEPTPGSEPTPAEEPIYAPAPHVTENTDGTIIVTRDGEPVFNYTGLAILDGGAAQPWVYVENGKRNKTYAGYVNYNGSKFYVSAGTMMSDLNGVMIDPNSAPNYVWYFCSNGQVQTQHKGLALYDGEWFYIENGKVAVEMNAFVEYDGGLFAVGAGRIISEYSGLMQDPQNPVSGDWYFFANGQAQTQYTGLAQYDGVWFYIVKGKLASFYTGPVDYNGGTFYVENGMVK